MTYTVDRPDTMAALKDSYARQVAFTEIMCAGNGDRPEFKESNVKRAGGKFATRAEKAKMAEDEAAANVAAYKAADPGPFAYPDGTEGYKFNEKQMYAFKEGEKEAREMAAPLADLAVTDPVKAVEKCKELNARIQSAAKELAAGDEQRAKYSEQRKKMVASEIFKKLTEQNAPIKAKAAAQVTKAIAKNMSSDEIQKGLVQVTKQLNSGTPAEPEALSEMIKGWAEQAQKNIDSGVKAFQKAGTDLKANSLAAGVGLMTKISEMNAAAKASAPVKAVGDVYNSASKSVNDAGSAVMTGINDATTSIKNSVVGKAVSDAAAGGQKNLNSVKDGALKTLGDAATGAKNSAVGKAVTDAATATGKFVGEKVNEAGFSADIKDLPGDLDQIRKDLEQDVTDGVENTRKSINSAGDYVKNSDAGKAAGNAYNAASATANAYAAGGRKNISNTKNGVLKTLGDAANTVKDSAAGKAVGKAATEAKATIDDNIGKADRTLGRSVAGGIKNVDSAKKNTLSTLGNVANAAAKPIREKLSDMEDGKRSEAMNSQFMGSLKQGPANKTNAQITQGPSALQSLSKAVAGGQKNLGSFGGSAIKTLGDAANAARDSAVGKAVGDAANATGKAIGDTATAIAKVPGAANLAVRKSAADYRDQQKRLEMGYGTIPGANAQGPANKTNAGIIKPAIQGPANKTNSQIVAKPSPMKALGDAANESKKKVKTVA